MTGYGQFCPVAKAMEILDGRWTMLVVRELLLGSRHFNELRRGLPRMSPALLSKRLHSLERFGIVRQVPEGRRSAYELTASGLDLVEVVNGLGRWGLTWITTLGDEDLDPHLLMWDMRRTIDGAAWPAGRTTVAVEFRDLAAQGRWWWLVVVDHTVDVCDVDPGHPVDLTVTTTLRDLTRIWRGEVGWDHARRTGAVELEGSTLARRSVAAWIGCSSLVGATTPRGRPGTQEPPGTL